MTFNLIREPWLPVRRRSGIVDHIPPWRITDRIAEDPIIGFAWPRPDFNGAAHELLIGLLSTASPPEDEDAWADWWNHPPTPYLLEQRFSTISSAFDLDGTRARFMQDSDALETAPHKEIAVLLIDTPGAQTLQNNADLFVKRGAAPALSRATAAMALFTLNTYAPSGGAGHRTSLRGGGPLTSLIIAEHAEYGANLWGRTWPNVESLEQIAERAVNGTGSDDLPRTFPWMSHTRTSEKAGGKDTTPADVHPLQVYWGMPRRIRLHFEEAINQRCGLSGMQDTVMVKHFRTKNYGTNYSDGFQHPLTPYYRQNSKSTTKLPEHPNPGGFSYRMWPRVVVSSKDRLREPAQAVRHWRHDRHARIPDRVAARLAAFGYDMDNMKARAWMEGEMPLYEFDEETRTWLEIFIRRATAGANTVARLLTGAVKSALHARPVDASGDFGFISERFFRDTEKDFYSALDMTKRHVRNHPDSEDPAMTPLQEWAKVLARAAEQLFDELADPGNMENRDMLRHVSARHYLTLALGGRGKTGKSLFETDLEIPSPAKPSFTHKKEAG